MGNDGYYLGAGERGDKEGNLVNIFDYEIVLIALEMVNYVV